MIFKIVCPLICCFCIHIQAKSYSQVISLEVKSTTIAKIFQLIEKQSPYVVLYNLEDLKEAKPVTLSVKSVRINQLMDVLFKDQPYEYTLDDKTILVHRKTKKETLSVKGKDTYQLPVAVQEREIAGIIKDDQGKAIAGVTIQVKGSNLQTKSDERGHFKIKVSPTDKVLAFSSVGFETLEQMISASDHLEIQLKSSLNNLNEVVVVGYGTALRKNLTTAVSTIKPDNISKAAISNMSQMLLGRAAGLQATLSSPQPGGDVNLSIRGAGTPIYIVDGIMMPGGQLEVGAGSTDVPNSIRRGGLAGLNPNDIESIEILKDASAAIYGIGAANGVILITTKKGTESSPRISYDGSHSVVKNYPYLKPLNGQDYMNLANLFNKENYLFTHEMYPYGPHAFDHNWIPQFTPDDIQAATTTDWLDHVLKNGSITNQNIMLSGGTKSYNYYLSGNYFNQDGTVANSGLKRYTMRSNLSAQLFPFLKLTAIANINQNYFTNSSAEGGSGGHGSGSLQSALTYPSYLPVYGADGKASIYQNFPNPAEMVKIKDNTRSNGYYLNFAADIDVIKDVLKGRVIYGLNKENTNRDLYIPSDIYFFQMYKSRGHLGYIERQHQTFESTLSFNKKINEQWRLEAVAGIGKYLQSGQGLEIDYQQINDNIGADNIAAAEGDYFPTSSRSGSERRSQFVRAGVDFKDRYIVSGTLRRDGTDKFFPGKKYGYFPSVSAAWKISNEHFLQGVSWIDQLKLRGSWGETGSDNLGSSLYGTYYVASQFIKFSNNSVTYIPYLLSGPDYPDVSWQKTTMKNIGVDFTLFANRVTGSFDVFRNDITDLLGNDPASPLSSSGTVPMNFGHYMRTGWEASVQTHQIKSASSFQWKSLITLSHYESTWVKREPNHYYEEYRARFYEPMNAYYYYDTDGIINSDRSNMPESQKSLSQDAQKPGYPIIKDNNGDNEITVDDVKMRNLEPQIILGFGNTFNYKNFDLDIFMYGQLGQWKRNYAYSWAMVGDLYYPGPKNSNQYAFEIWNSQNNTEGTRRGIASTKAVALPGDVGYVEDLQDASFVRVRNITLGYNFNLQQHKVISKYVKNIRLFVDTQNPFTFTKFVGVDPEAQTGGYYTGYNSLSAAEYPMVRTYTIGAAVSF